MPAMKRLLATAATLVLAAAACGGRTTDVGAPSGPEGKAENGDVTLAWRTPAAGATWTKSRSERVEMMYGGQPVTLEQRVLQHVEVIESGDVVTRLAVTIEEDREVQHVAGESRTKSNPTEGRSYVLWKEGDQLVAALPDGALASSEELEELDSFEDDVGRRQGIAVVLLRHPWQLGAATALEGQDLLDLASDLNEGVVVEDAVMTLARVDGDTAVFELAMNATSSIGFFGRT
jgi:hypothetical protein